LLFPGGDGTDLTRLRNGHGISHMFKHWAVKLGFPSLRFHDLRGSHETALLDAGGPLHGVAASGHDPAVLLRAYAKRTQKADDDAAAAIDKMSKNILGQSFGSNMGRSRISFQLRSTCRSELTY
jgi:integrase